MRGDSDMCLAALSLGENPPAAFIKQIINEGKVIESRCKGAYKAVVGADNEGHREGLQRVVGELAIYVKLRNLLGTLVPIDDSVKKQYTLLLLLENELAKTRITENVIEVTLAEELA